MLLLLIALLLGHVQPQRPAVISHPVYNALLELGVDLEGWFDLPLNQVLSVQSDGSFEYGDISGSVSFDYGNPEFVWMTLEVGRMASDGQIEQNGPAEFDVRLGTAWYRLTWPDPDGDLNFPCNPCMATCGCAGGNGGCDDEDCDTAESCGNNGHCEWALDAGIGPWWLLSLLGLCRRNKHVA